MTDREKAVVSAYTGVTMLAGEKFQIFHKYIEDILGRPVWTHELGNELVWNEIKEKSKDDFLEICKAEERTSGHWIEGTQGYYCSECEEIDQFYFEHDYCPKCGAKMEE